MERVLQAEPVMYAVLMPSPQLTQQVTSIGTSPGPCYGLIEMLLLRYI